MADPNYSVLDEDSSDEEDEGENSFLKVKKSLASTGNNNTLQMWLMLVKFAIMVRLKVLINYQNTSTEELKKLAQRQAVLRNMKITQYTVSYLGSYIRGNSKEIASGERSNDTQQHKEGCNLQKD